MELPRVSDILRILDDSYTAVPAETLAYAAERGIRLHNACLTGLAVMEGAVSIPLPVADEDRSAVDAFMKWATGNKISVIAIEYHSINFLHGYQGTPDALVMINGEEVLIDLKFTAKIIRTNKVQIQAYRELDLYKTAKKAMLIHINPKTGALKTHVVNKSQRDMAAFLNALSVWKWRNS